MLINIAAFVVVVAGIMAAKTIMIPFLLATFLAIICGPALYWLKQRGVPAMFSVFFLVVVVVLLETLLATLITSSLSEFSAALPAYQQRLHTIVANLLAWLNGHGIEITGQVVLDQFDPGKLMRFAGNMLNNLFGVLTNTFMVILTLVFILLEASGFPAKLRACGHHLGGPEQYARVIRGVNRYLALKTATSLVTGILVGIGLRVIGVDFALMWGVLAFVLNFVPTIGSIVAAVPPVLLALVQLGPGAALWTGALFLLINVGIGNILEPRIMGARVGLSPLVIFVSMAFWGWVLGPVGMLLSVPLTMTIKIILSYSGRGRTVAVLLGSHGEAEQLAPGSGADKGGEQ